MLHDRSGFGLSTASQEAAAAYVLGVDALLGAEADAGDHLQRAVDADPRFALAHLAKARCHFLDADGAAARAAVARARELAAFATPREQGHVQAIALGIEGRPVDALAASRTHLAEHPRDALVLAPLTGVFGLIGFSGRAQREQELYDLLHALAPHYADDWWFDTAFAFAACECGRLAEARERIERSLEARRSNAHGAHVMAHVLHEDGQAERSLEFLAGWMPRYARRGLMHCHLSWHMALAALTLGRTEQAWQVYRSAVHPGAAWGPPLNVVTDAAAFLWRAGLAGEQPQPELWHEVHGHALASFPKVGVSFADVHVGVACAAVHDAGTLQRLDAALHERLAAGRLPPGAVVPRLVTAFADFARGEWDAAIQGFELSMPQTVRIGGSRAQRDIVDHTLLAAYLASGRPDDAARLIGQRTGRRPVIEVRGLAQA